MYFAIVKSQFYFGQHPLFIIKLTILSQYAPDESNRENCIFD